MRNDSDFPYSDIIGQFRQFGPYGPSYEVLKVAGMDSEKGWMMTIRMLETNEVLAYPYRKMAGDPVAH